VRGVYREPSPDPCPECARIGGRRFDLSLHHSGGTRLIQVCQLCHPRFIKIIFETNYTYAGTDAVIFTGTSSMHYSIDWDSFDKPHQDEEVSRPSWWSRVLDFVRVPNFFGRSERSEQDVE
jgi:hypothetical protein